VESQSRNWANSIIREYPSSRGRHCVLQKIAKNYDQRTCLGRKQISALPLRLAGSQALAQYKKSVLAH
jgi:hypothetical protein